MYNLDAILSVGYRVNSKRAASDLATAIRTVVVLLMALMVVFITHGQTGLGSISPRSWLFLILSGLATGRRRGGGPNTRKGSQSRSGAGDGYLSR